MDDDNDDDDDDDGWEVVTFVDEKMQRSTARQHGGDQQPEAF